MYVETPISNEPGLHYSEYESSSFSLNNEDLSCVHIKTRYVFSEQPIAFSMGGKFSCAYFLVDLYGNMKNLTVHHANHTIAWGPCRM